ncbi:hypothetical protein DZC71_07610, partial [Campylobacter hepaticus]
ATIQAKDTALHLSNTTITNFLNMDTIKAENGKAIDTLKQTNITNFINAGTIQGGSSQEAIKFADSVITNILNTGNIEGKKQAIVFTRSKITNFINSGTIKSTNGSGNKDNAIEVNGNSSIENFFNSGVIEAKTEAVRLGSHNGNGSNKPKITTFINTGTISSENQSAVKLGNDNGTGQTQIDYFINTGTITTKGDSDVNNGGNDVNSDAAFAITQTNLKLFINSGLLAGKKMGVNVLGSTIDNFINTGIIVGASDHYNGSAIYLLGFSSGVAHIKTLQNDGLLLGNNGIRIADTNTVETIINKGIIAANSNGIGFNEVGGGSEIKITQIILEEGSQIIANKNGINLSVEGVAKTNVSIGSINIQEGAKVSGQEAGIKISQSNQFKNNNGSKKDNTVGQIIVAGEVKGGSEGGIVNEGTIKASENKSSSENGKKRSRRSLEDSSNQQSDEENKAAILIKESGQITSTSGYGIVNKAMIDGSIISKSSSNI